jgi:hypothetical protein
MEYLMTYGWAILIMAVVLVVLYSLGIFNGFLGARAQPGNCFVDRPNGPNTTQDVGVSGSCGGMLPEYTAQFNGYSYANTTVDFVPGWGHGVTETAWIYLNALPGPSGISPVFYNGGSQIGSGMYIDSSGDLNAFMTAPPCAIIGTTVTCNAYTATLTSMPLSLHKWYFVSMNASFTSNSVWACAASGTSKLTCSSPATASQSFETGPTNNFQIGNDSAGDLFLGSIANVQIYSTDLSANDLTAVNSKGIGGAPIDVVDLVGWWPLNGNANDYSGNKYNGQAFNGVSYSSDWSTGYTAP